MKKKWNYIIGIIALGIVIFNNSVQLAEIIKQNQNYMIGLFISLIASVFYGIVNLE